MSNYPPVNGIKSWAEEDRPREKMLSKGRHVLTDAELIAILLATGYREKSAVDVAKEILASVDYDLNALGTASLSNLMKFKGIGEAKAITIAAALELGRRRQDTTPKERPVIGQSKDAWRVLYPLLSDLPHEMFYILLLNRANKVLEAVRISEGGITGTVVDARILFRKVLENDKATSVILAHNHPSGQLKPSKADLDLTKKLVQAGTTLDISVLDHLIIGEGDQYVSFADEGWM